MFMDNIKLILKTIMGTAFRVYASIFRPFRSRNVIIMYHRVLDGEAQGIYDPAMYVTRNTLNMHLRELGRHFQMVPLNDILKTEDGVRGQCAITFDDGWKDNYDNAFPLLKQYQIPATIFLTTNMIGKRSQFWFHAIWHLAEHSIRESKESRFFEYFSRYVLLDDGNGITDVIVNKIIASIKEKDTETIDEVVADAYRFIGVVEDKDENLLNWEQVSEMSSQGIRIGSHGLNHYILTRVSDEIKLREISESYALLLEKGIDVDPVFCYPNGNWDNESIRYLKNTGHKGAVTTRLGCNTINSNPYILNRVGVHDEISRTPALLWYRLFQARIAS